MMGRQEREQKDCHFTFAAYILPAYPGREILWRRSYHKQGNKKKKKRPSPSKGIRGKRLKKEKQRPNRHDVEQDGGVNSIM